MIFPITFFVGLYLRLFSMTGPEEIQLSYKWFTKCNWLPVWYHYYQPIIKENMLPKNYQQIEYPLIGIDLVVQSQLALLHKFHYNSELEAISLNETQDYQPYYRNRYFGIGDGEILYSIVRHYKPNRIIEIGSGYSTRFILRAAEKNKSESGASTEIICVEPFENKWLEELGVTVIRKRVEQIELSFFKKLSENDILFIDSSHVIRTHGDVVFEYLSIIPSLPKGVIVHAHDIFLPKGYPLSEITECKFFWNEQYLLQALLSYPSRYKTLLSLNYLSNHHRSDLEKCCPIFQRETEEHGPSSFWFQVME